MHDEPGRDGRITRNRLAAAATMLGLVVIIAVGFILGSQDESESPGSTATAAATGSDPASGPPSVAPEATASTDSANEATEEAAETPAPVGPPPSSAPSTPDIETAVEEDLTAESALLGPASTARPTTVDPVDPVAAGLLEGPYAEAVAATAIEYEAMGYTQVGVPTIVSVEIQDVDLDSVPPAATVIACLDNSTTDVVDSSGKSIRNEATPARSRYLYTLNYVNGAWGIIQMTFPDDPDC